jgi:hypothetical protein
LDGLLLHITGSSEGRLGPNERQKLIVLRDDDSALREFFANTIKPQIISIHDLSRDFSCSTRLPSALPDDLREFLDRCAAVTAFTPLMRPPNRAA